MTTLDWVMGAFAETLKIDRTKVEPTSSFFALGGESLDLAELLLRVEDYLGFDVEHEQFVGIETPEALAALLDRLNGK